MSDRGSEKLSPIMASLSELRELQQQRQQARRPPVSSTTRDQVTSGANVNEPSSSIEVTSPRRTAAHRHRRQPAISTLRVTNPDVGESKADCNVNETHTHPNSEERAAGGNSSSNLTTSALSGTVECNIQNAPEVSSELSGVDSPGAPNSYLTSSSYQAPPLLATNNSSPPPYTSRTKSNYSDPFDRAYSPAAFERTPRGVRESIRSFVRSQFPPGGRKILHPEALAKNITWTMPNGDKVPQPGPARLSKGAGPDEWLEAAKQCKYLPEAHMKQLCEIVKEFLMEESNIQPVKTPVTVCGDIHGQFYDLLELFRVAGGMPNDTNVADPTVPTKVITSDDIEPPSTITDPKLKKKLKRVYDSNGESAGSSEVSTDASDEDEEERGRTRGIEDELGMKEGGSKAGFTAAGDQSFIFLGDFVDRGYFSLETFTLLMCLKAKFPDRITLIRGNHESRQITQVYGFYEECQTKYGNASVWKACCQVFDFLPLAAVVDGKVLCVHGGLSPEIRTLDQVRVVARAQEIPHEGAFCDLVWSDPEDVDTWAVSPRGAGWLFGDKVASEFNHVNGLSLIARAHQLVNEGFKYHFKAKDVVTVWSAPNYCYRCGNVASIMNLDEDSNPKFAIFSAVPDEQRAVPTATGRRTEYFL